MSLYAIAIFLNQLLILIYVDFTRQECTEPKSAGVGSVIFNPTDVSRPCWSSEEIAILTARMVLEDVLPDPTRIVLDTNKSVDELVNYFMLIFNNIRQNTRGRGKHLMLVALCDLLGGYMRMAVLPIARRGFYAGVIDYVYMEKLIQLYEELKWFLRTNGQGWTPPMDTTKVRITVQTINLDKYAKDNRSCCRKLIYYNYDPMAKSKRFVPNSILDEGKNSARIKRGDKDLTVYFPLPFFDSKIYPSAIVVPLKRYALRNIESRKASYLIMKFFLDAHQCLEFLKADERTKRNFRNRLYNWILKDVDPKLGDDKFYAAFGGILRVQETLISMRANLNEPCDTVGEGEHEIGAFPKKQTRKGKILFIIMLIMIILWFIFGTCFICRKMRENQNCNYRKSDRTNTSNTCSISSSNKWPVWSRSSSRTCKCCSTSEKASSDYVFSTDSGKSKTDSKASIKHFRSSPCVCSSDEPAVIEPRHSRKVLTSIEELSEYSSQSKQMSQEDQSTLSNSDLDRRSSPPTNMHRFKVCIPKGIQISSKDFMPCPNLPNKATSLSSLLSKSTDVQAVQADDQETEDIRSANSGDISNKQALSSVRANYSDDNRCACHSSLSGKYHCQLTANQKPFLQSTDVEEEEEDDQDSEDIRSIISAGISNKQALSSVGANYSDDNRCACHSSLSGKYHCQLRANQKPFLQSTDVEEEQEDDQDSEDIRSIISGDISSKQALGSVKTNNTCACHSSLSGKYRCELTANQKPFIFGYDFHTSSSSSEEDSDGTDVRN